MTAAGCGCSAIETAAAHQDPGAAETIAASASDSQHGWRCPNAGHPEPCHDDPPLGEDQQAALVAVKNLTGASGFKTCPLWYTRQPWIGEVIAAWRAEKNGQLRERVGWPSLALYQAIEIVDAAFTARKAEAMRRVHEKTEDNEPPWEPR